MLFSSPEFWIAFVQIIWINVLLSGDNAVVIAMACRSLPDRARKWGIVLGSGVAVGLRIVFTGIVATLLALPWLKVVGSLALFYIAVDLALPNEDGEEAVQASESLWRAVGTVALADVFMSLDNVVAVAAVAHGDLLLLALGLAISIPLIVAGSSLVMTLLDRFPILVWAGAALLGWVAGEMLLSDTAITSRIGGVEVAAHWSHITAAAGAAFVVVVAWSWSRLRGRNHPRNAA
ncbi:TerC family protein [Azorhizobium doebereinerae]|uniref:TerC family protein n=1 Tax=Azorhizobium doebereinerae TaxID=281091 RepID=UPI00041C878D|nr:TerC family protein [Azorhizobium doebereinerae]